MKRQFFILIAIAAFATALTANASAQTGKTLRANVKFDFQIGDRSYPAGEYRIKPVSYQNDNILQIKSTGDTNKEEMILANYSNTSKNQTPKLVFQKRGESYFLTRIFFDSGQWGYSIPSSRDLRESDKHLASRVPRNN